MTAFAQYTDFACNDFSCKRVATQFRGFYGSEAREGRTMLDRLKAGLICNVHAGGIKRRTYNRGDVFTPLASLPIVWDAAKAEYLAERKAAREASIARQKEQAQENALQAQALLAQRWVERSTETEPDIKPGIDYRSYEDHHRDGFTIGSDSWRGTQVVIEQDYRNPATIKVTSMGNMSPLTARAVAKALLMAADLADIRDTVNGPKVDE